MKFDSHFWTEQTFLINMNKGTLINEHSCVMHMDGVIIKLPNQPFFFYGVSRNLILSECTLCKSNDQHNFLCVCIELTTMKCELLPQIHIETLRCAFLVKNQFVHNILCKLEYGRISGGIQIKAKWL